MAQDTKRDRQDRLLGRGIEGSMSRSESLAEQDPRGRRGAQRELDFGQRFDPAQFSLDSNGRVSLRLQDRPRTRTDHLDFVKRHHGDANNPTVIDNSAAAGNAVYASVVEAFATGEYLFMVWPFPGDIDLGRPVLLDLGVVERSDTAGAALKMSWDLALWSWAKGETLTRAADKTLQVVDQALPASPLLRDVDQRVPFTIPAGTLLPGSLSLKMKLTRQAATGTDPLGIAVHEILLTYGVRDYHTHE